MVALSWRAALAVAVLGVCGGALKFSRQQLFAAGAQEGLSADQSALAEVIAAFSKEILVAAGKPASTAVNATAKAAAANLTANHTAGPNRTTTLMNQHEALQGLLGRLKLSITKMNAHEAESKETGMRQIERLQKRLAEERAQLNRTNNTKFMHELLVNRTRSDENELQYWSRSRNLQHGMFHSSLKVTHGMMKKAEAVIAAYKTVLDTGKLPSDMSKQIKALAASLPAHSFF